MAEVRRWQRGETIMLRFPLEDRMVRAYRAARGDTVLNVAGTPAIVLEDTPQRLVTYMPEGAPSQRWDVVEQRFRLTNGLDHRPGLGDSLRIFYAGKRYEVSLYYETGSGPAPWVKYYFPGVEGRFYGWKVDLCSPFARTEAGIDMIDDVIDLVVTPERLCDWRDLDEMEMHVRLGIYSEHEAEELRQLGRDVIGMVQRHEPPFDDEWQNWRPESDLVLGKVMEGWQLLPMPEPYRAFTDS